MPKIALGDKNAFIVKYDKAFHQLQKFKGVLKDGR